MYRIKLSEVYSLHSCRIEYQVGDSYDAWGKIACSALNTRLITTSPCFVTAGIGEFYPEPAKFFQEIRKAVGSSNFDRVIEINDDHEGCFGENHERSLKLALQLCLQSGLVEIEDEDTELIRELRKRIVDVGDQD